MQYSAVLDAVTVLKNEGIIAYPTESVFGLGCDPDSNNALSTIIGIKRRDPSKGMLLVCHDFLLAEKYVNLSKVSDEDRVFVRNYWPGPYTFLFPASSFCKQLLIGDHSTIAIRVSTHPIIKMLCTEFNKPIVSTSANLSGELPCLTSADVHRAFNNSVNFILDGETLGYSKPSTIIDLKTREILRN